MEKNAVYRHAGVQPRKEGQDEECRQSKFGENVMMCEVEGCCVGKKNGGCGAGYPAEGHAVVFAADEVEEVG